MKYKLIRNDNQLKSIIKTIIFFTQTSDKLGNIDFFILNESTKKMGFYNISLKNQTAVALDIYIYAQVYYNFIFNKCKVKNILYVHNITTF